ncbi:uncharacterized SAM-binding protein YcdF (DUF218 family) [Sphingomonas jejuensis]|uniref:Uncharacterized SAM-binding protein YcdF (DUF218 family) n=1 Tax=Sphingomonas jejuensis TaxID=904715 RepID=A0ABX0XNX4_9SPHN|nr:YdcF family protein [Sphingomonas jejuensis]NJC34935.1 uncharacterized SAM-binding protein YcdF (DUF218 family) [Sphingomonas jejuensis]
MLRVGAILVTLYLLGFAAFATSLPRPLSPDRTDGIVVLTGGAGRIERGLDLLEDGAADRMLISGVGIAVRPQELAVRTGRPQRLFDCCVDLGHEAVDTRSNGDEVAAWVGRQRYRTVRLVTSDWHMRRAAFEITRALPGGVALSEDAVRTEPSLRVLNNEYNKYLLRRGAAVVGW